MIDQQDDLPTITVWEKLGAVYGYVGDISAYQLVRWRPEFNGLGDWTLDMAFTDEAAELLRDRWVLIEWRDFATTWGIVRRPYSDPDTGQDLLEVTGVKAIAVLGREVAYTDPTLPIDQQPIITPDDVAPYKGPAETVIKQIVQQNMIDRRGETGLVVTPTQGRGTVQPARPIGDNLLELVTNLANLGGIGVDLNLVRLNGPSDTRAVLTFDAWTPEDKTTDIILTQDAGNLEGYEQPETEPTATMAHVGGAGGSGTGGFDRFWLPGVTTPASEAQATAWGGHRVVLVDGPATFDPDELRQAGEQALLDGAGTQTLSLTVVDSEGTKAFRDFTPGERATGQIGATEVQDVITSIEVTVVNADGGGDPGVTVSATFGNPSATDPQTDIADQLGKAKRSIRRLERRH